jgi:hypothetical protein
MTNDHSSDDNTVDTNSQDDHADHSSDDHADQGHDDHGHGGHGQDDSAPEASTLTTTTGRQLIFPALILIIVGILLIGPVTGAFAPKPGSAGTNTSILPTSTPAPPTTVPTAAPTGVPSGTASPVAALPAQTSPPTSTIAGSPPTVAAVTATTVSNADVLATRTAVAQAGEQGVVTRAPVELDFAGAKFMVQSGGELLPDWQTDADDGQAVWVSGTFANHIIYLPYSDTNATLFSAVKLGDPVTLVMDSGQTFQFSVTRAQRAFNGPPANADQFTTTTAMNQDHAGVTLFLVGDPASDRAVVQADFNGNIQ